MAAADPSPKKESTRPPARSRAAVALAPDPPNSQVDEQLSRLGRNLESRAEEVLTKTVERTISSGQVVDAFIQESLEGICRISTIAVGRWMAGDGLEVTNKAGRETRSISASWRRIGERR